MSNWMKENGERVRTALTTKGFVFDEVGNFVKVDTEVNKIPYSRLTEEELRVIFKPYDEFITECEDDDGFDFAKVATMTEAESVDLWEGFYASAGESGEILTDISDLHTRAFMFIYNTNHQDAEWLDNAYVYGVDTSDVTKYVDMVVNTILMYFMGSDGMIHDYVIRDGYHVIAWPFKSGFADVPEIINRLASVKRTLNECAAANA